MSMPLAEGTAGLISVGLHPSSDGEDHFAAPFGTEVPSITLTVASAVPLPLCALMRKSPGCFAVTTNSSPLSACNAPGSEMVQETLRCVRPFWSTRRNGLDSPTSMVAALGVMVTKALWPHRAAAQDSAARPTIRGSKRR